MTAQRAGEEPAVSLTLDADDPSRSKSFDTSAASATSEIALGPAQVSTSHVHLHGTAKVVDASGQTTHTLTYDVTY